MLLTRARALPYGFLYSVAFVILATSIYQAFIAFGVTFIWEGDGWKQHYPALVYYSMFLRDAFGGLLSGGGLSVPHYDFNIGEGEDILTALHYYAFGDPLNLLAVFVFIGSL